MWISFGLHRFSPAKSSEETSGQSRGAENLQFRREHFERIRHFANQTTKIVNHQSNSVWTVVVDDPIWFILSFSLLIFRFSLRMASRIPALTIGPSESNRNSAAEQWESSENLFFNRFANWRRISSNDHTVGLQVAQLVSWKETLQRNFCSKKMFI